MRKPYVSIRKIPRQRRVKPFCYQPRSPGGRNYGSILSCGSSAFVVLSTKEKTARAGLGRQRTPPQGVRDDSWGETSLNAVLHWFLDRQGNEFSPHDL